MMCLRDRPRSFGPGPVGQKTLVQISSDSRRTPCRALPSTASALVPAYDVRGVEGGDAFVERRGDAGERRVLLDLGAVGDPVPVSDLADFQAAAAEMTMLHIGST